MHEILKIIPHKRVTSQQENSEEIFDLFQCGIFNNGSIEENLEIVALQPQSEYKPHYHQNSSAIIYIIAGSGIFQLGKDLIQYKPNMRIVIPAGVLHGFKTETATLFISIQSPPIMNPLNGEIDLHYEHGETHATAS